MVRCQSGPRQPLTLLSKLVIIVGVVNVIVSLFDYISTLIQNSEKSQIYWESADLILSVFMSATIIIGVLVRDHHFFIPWLCYNAIRYSFSSVHIIHFLYVHFKCICTASDRHYEPLITQLAIMSLGVVSWFVVFSTFVEQQQDNETMAMNCSIFTIKTHPAADNRKVGDLPTYAKAVAMERMCSNPETV